jgi:hypothetical protein
MSYRWLFSVAIFFLCLLPGAAAQQCPRENSSGPPTASAELTLEGQLVYHDGLRQWFELRLDKPVCGQASTELVRIDDQKQFQILRGCRVRTKGVLGIPLTGYFSLNTYQDVAEIEPVGDCTKQPPFPDDPKAAPDPKISRYRVKMLIHYGENAPVVLHVSSAGKPLEPWQVYASYNLTGGFVLYGHCAEGFVVDRVFGTPQAHPQHFEGPRTPEDAALFDPESAAAAGQKELHLGWTCVRTPQEK